MYFFTEENAIPAGKWEFVGWANKLHFLTWEA